MAYKTSKKFPKGRLNILIMRAKGEVSNLAISPAFLAIAVIFSLLFIFISIVVMHRYMILYFDYRALLSEHQSISGELFKLKNKYAYTASVAEDYAELMNAMNKVDPQNGQSGEPGNGSADGLPEAAAEETEPGNGLPEHGDGAAPVGTSTLETEPLPGSVEAWGARLPEASSPREQFLDVNRLQIVNDRFSFHLTNEHPASAQAQGRLLLVFAVEVAGQTQLIPFPKFAVDSSNPDFAVGLGYNIRSSKPFSGRLETPPGGVVKEAMVAAKSSSGKIVLKKKLKPQ
jgi:hypothetical protein